jgi:CheY-like chemotaxis protein
MSRLPDVGSLRGKMANILIVDNEALLVETLSRALKSKGHTIVTASNGIEGLKRFAEGACDLVITDIIMPDMDGIEMMMKIRQRAPAVKIIAMSGGGRTGNVELVKAAAQLGAVATLRKPIRMAELFQAVNECLADIRGGTKTVPQS